MVVVGGVCTLVTYIYSHTYLERQPKDAAADAHKEGQVQEELQG